ncbi:Wzy polymerase domain-containing protein [Enterobacter hormaechei]
MKINYSTANVFITVAGVWLVFLMHIPFYNLGGSGFTLPQNITTWMVVAVLCCVTLLTNPLSQVVITPFLIAILAGSLLMTAPLLWSENHVAAVGATPHFCGLWAGVLFYFVLLQVSFTEKTVRLFLWFITLSAVIEGCIVLQTLFLPGTLGETSLRFYTDNGRGALGTFQQVNVTASWLATGLAAQIVLLFTSRANITWEGRLGSCALKLATSSFVLATLTACIVLTRSRIGWLGGILCYLIILCVLLKTRRFMSAKGLVLIFAPLVGIIAGLMMLDCPVAQAIRHTGSNHQRLLTLKETLEMIMQHPFKGWGPGTFRTEFQRYMASHFVINPSRELMGHPHNEALYIWFEGGIIALAGYLLIMLAIGWLIVSRPDNQRKMTGIILLPVMLHSWTEFPFYYSSTHFIVLLILIALLDLTGRSTPPGFTISSRMEPALTLTRYAMVLVSACTVLWLIKAFTTESLLSHFEDGTLRNPESITQIIAPPLTMDRYSHDLNLLNLLHYNVTGDQKWLQHYLSINTQWLRHHPEPDDYDNQIQVLLVTGQKESAEKYRISASQLFPWDARFSRGSHEH